MLILFLISFIIINLLCILSIKIPKKSERIVLQSDYIPKAPKFIIKEKKPK